MAVTTERSASTTAIRPFTVEFPEADVADLRARIAATRFPETEPVEAPIVHPLGDNVPPQGVELATMEALVRYWGGEYDLRRVEARLNALPQFLTEIDGLDIHFIHVKSRHENALPVILIHGWPGSVVEMLSVIGPLTDPTAHGGSAEDAFDVVIPSMPGYGLSGKPNTSGWGPEHIAGASVELMKRLGYTRFVAQGGDWGAVIVDLMGVQAPPELAAIHSNMPGVIPPELAPRVRAAGRRSGARRAFARRAACLRAGELHVHPGNRLRRPDAAASTDAVRDRRLARRAGRLDRGPRRPELPGHHQRLRQRTACWQPDAGRGARQHHADMVDEYRGLLGSPVSRERVWLLRRQGRVGPRRGYRVPQGALSGSPELGRARISQPRLLQRGRYFAAWQEPQLFSEEVRAAFRSLR